MMIAACGRFDFSEPAGEPLHLYQLQGNFVDDYGGPALEGEKCATATNCLAPRSSGYKDDVKNKGLALVGAIPSEVYTIDLMIMFPALSVSSTNCDGYAKLIDFKNLTTDQGLYARESEVRFATGGCDEYQTTTDAPLKADTLTEITISRDAKQMISVWVNKKLEDGLTFTDRTGLATFDQAGAIAHFGDDDIMFDRGEWVSSVIREITIWDFPLSAEQVIAIPPPPPLAE